MDLSALTEKIAERLSAHESGVKTAGTECRKLLLNLKNLCVTMRKDILAEQKARVTGRSEAKKKAQDADITAPDEEDLGIEELDIGDDVPIARSKKKEISRRRSQK